MKETEINDRNHDMLYTDNGDGTHSGVCEWHNRDVEISREKHDYKGCRPRRC